MGDVFNDCDVKVCEERCKNMEVVTLKPNVSSLQTYIGYYCMFTPVDVRNIFHFSKLCRK